MTLTDTNDPILAIDPGSEQSGWVVYDGVDVLACGIHANDVLLDGIVDSDWIVDNPAPVHLVIERVMP